jgi:hypothetical protein
LISTLSCFQSHQVGPTFEILGVFLLLQTIIRPFCNRRIISKSFSCISLRAPPCRLAF